MAIKVKIVKGECGIERYEISGHSGYAPIGQDIVCAAVSAIAQAVALGLKQAANTKLEYSAEPGKLICSIEKVDMRRKRRVQLLMETLELAFKDLRNQYPDNISLSVVQLDPLRYN